MLIETSKDMVITWTTFTDTPSSVVEFGNAGLTDTATGSSTQFTDGGSEHRNLWMHRVILKDLQPDTMYCESFGLKVGGVIRI